MAPLIPTFLLCFFLACSVTSIFGVASYFLGRWFRRVKPSWAVPIDCVLAVLSIAAFTLSIIPVVLFCWGGACAERKNNEDEKPLAVYFVQLLSSTTFAHLLLLLVFVRVAVMHPTLLASALSLISPSINAIPPAYQEFALYSLFGGYGLGIVATPSVVAIFRWFFNNSRLRPGLDRHFHGGEQSVA